MINEHIQTHKLKLFLVFTMLKLKIINNLAMKIELNFRPNIRSNSFKNFILIQWNFQKYENAFFEILNLSVEISK